MVTAPERPRRPRKWPILDGCFLWAACLVIGGCRDLPPAGHASPPGELGAELHIFVFDRSTSVLDHEIDHARELTRERISGLDHGDRIVGIELLQHSLAEEPKRWSQQVPLRQFPDRVAPRDSVARARFLQDARDYIAQFADPGDRDHIDGTDILSTLHLVAYELQAHPTEQPTLFLFSDMLQANHVMNMEGLVRMPPPNWVARQSENGALPDLRGLCVVALGARKDTPGAQLVKDFWTEYFESTGAVLLDRNYSYRPLRLPRHPCQGG